MQTLTIREAMASNGADAEAVLAFHRSLYLDHRRTVTSAGADPDCSSGELEAAVAGDARTLLMSQASIVLLASEGARAIGYITGHVVTGRPCARGVVEDWYVVPEARRSGVGAKLLRALLKRFADAGCAVAESTTVAGNDTARRAHIKVGFVEAEIRYRMRLDK